MFRRILGKLRTIPGSSARSDRASILLPFLIISIGLGVLAWRSYQLSAHMERGVDTLAMQYAGYAADITARRFDSAIRNEQQQADEQMQQIDRRPATPTHQALQTWLEARDWMMSAIYVPDSDPTASIFVSKRGVGGGEAALLTREFYTASGLIRYTYDPSRLIERVRGVLHEKPLVQSNELQPEARLSIVSSSRGAGVIRMADGFAFIAPLAAPLSAYSIRAYVPIAYGTSGWENARFISVMVSLVAFALTTLGALLALRGLKGEAETMKLRGALIANVSHELRTPLSMIRLGAETLKRSTRLTEPQRHELVDSILREVLHLSHLVENVLDIARIQNSSARALALTPVKPFELVTSVVGTYEAWIRSKGFFVGLQVEDTVDEQLWDRDAVSRALLNLIDNAVKYSADEKVIEVVLRQTADDVVIEVKDRGIGIEQRDLSHIFEPYYRAQFSDTQTRRGAGLGLTLVRQIVASHGGRVEVESARAAGSTFRLLFPRVRAESREPLASLAQAPQAF